MVTVCGGYAVFIGTRRRGVAATIAFGGLAAGVVTGCAGNSHKAAPKSTATGMIPVAAEIQHDVARVWPEAGRIWPGIVLKDRRIIIGDGRAIRLIGTDGVSAVTPAALASKKITIPSTGSLYTTWEGHPAIALNAADPEYVAEAKEGGVSLSAVLFGAATDELFHSWQQRGTSGGGTRARGTEYPLAVTPRLDRAMIYNNVLGAYHDPHQRARHLGAAAYWYGQWQKDYPDEAKRAVLTDANEGAAGYFDTVATAMVNGADRKDVADVRAHTSFSPLDESLDPRRLTLDGESAPIGSIAGLLLDDTHKGWQKEVAGGGKTPLGLLLQGVAPVAEQPSDGLRQSIQDVLAKQNSDLIPRFTPLVGAYNDKSDALLLVPLNSATGDLETGGYYTSKDVPFVMLARVTGTFRFATGRLRAHEASVLTGSIGRDQYLIVPIDPAHAGTRVTDGRVHLTHGPLTGTFQVKNLKVDGRERLVAM